MGVDVEEKRMVFGSEPRIQYYHTIHTFLESEPTAGTARVRVGIFVMQTSMIDFFSNLS